MKKSVHLIVTLTLITSLSGFLLSFVNKKTEEAISSQKEEKINSALESFFKNESIFTVDSIQTESGFVTYWTAYEYDHENYSSSQKLLGYIFKTRSFGYSSQVQSLVAISSDNKIIGIRILSQEETPGLGSRATESISQNTFWNGIFKKKVKVLPWFQEQFSGLSIENPITIKKSGEWHSFTQSEKEMYREENAVTAITGATITTKAVIKSIDDIRTIVKQINSPENLEEEK